MRCEGVLGNEAGDTVGFDVFETECEAITVRPVPHAIRRMHHSSPEPFQRCQHPFIRGRAPPELAAIAPTWVAARASNYGDSPPTFVESITIADELQTDTSAPTELSTGAVNASQYRPADVCCGRQRLAPLLAR